VTSTLPIEHRRAGWFTLSLVLINVVGDGWSGRPIGLCHQLLLLPISLLFLVGMGRFLFAERAPQFASLWSTKRAASLVFAFEMLAAALFLYECHHFASLGYHFYPLLSAGVFLISLVCLGWVASGRDVMGLGIFGVSLACYTSGMVMAIVSFPLNYLRSDMLPVILWADTNLLHRISPYATMFVGGRVYDFPYLPGMLVAYLPFVAAHLDIRFGSIAYVVASALLIFWLARGDRRREVAAVLALFLLCPYLQFRHELYLQPHWFTLVLAFVLMQRRHYACAALAFGVGMSIYQFSWILFPFFVLNAFRRRGWGEAAKLTLVGAAGTLAVVSPFLVSATKRIASNTVGQWGTMPHALADPMNFSYWVTYLIRPDKLLRLQAGLMIVIFIYCVIRGRCEDLTDTLRWMIVALTLFILLNVLVDGYFYLMLLVPMLVFTCVANGWWREPGESVVAVG
jgi:hypothetical protein